MNEVKKRPVKPYKRVVRRKGKYIAVCRHCGGEGWDGYMLQGDLWKMVLPPNVEPAYYAGFVCLPCALESIDRPLWREDITGGLPGQGAFTMIETIELEIGLEIIFPKRDAKRKTHILQVKFTDCDDDDEIIDAIINECQWLLERLAIQTKSVIVRAGDVTIGKIRLLTP